jgi:hypothetical protein
VTSTTTFLHTLWPEDLGARAIQIWEKRSGKNYTFNQLDAVATFAVGAARSSDVYIAAGLAPAVVKPVKTRATNVAVVGIPGVWMDLDVNGGPLGKTGVCPDFDAAHGLAGSLAAPTVVVMSGYGLQAWWLFEEPWLFASEDERTQAARLVHGFQAAMKAQGRERDWTGFDSTFDLARLMRLPGTLNHKGPVPVPVELLEEDGPRHTVEHLSRLSATFFAEASEAAAELAAGTVVKIAVDGERQPPFERIEELQDIIPEFAGVWRHTPSRARTGWTDSQYDMSIANYCVQAGFSDQEIADTIAYHRRKYGGDPKGKGSRLDYLQKTIARARSGHERQAREREAEEERDHTITQLTSIGKEPSTPAAVTIHLFTKVVGGPAVSELIQDGRDPDTCRYRMVLASGDEVPIGSASALINQDRFRERFMVVTGHLPMKVKAVKWDEVVQALLNAATVKEGEEDTRAARVRGWLEGYLERRVSTDRDQACQVQDPFVRDGDVHVALGQFHQWLRKIKGERIAEVDVKQLLEAANFQRRTINYVREDGRKSSRSYYVAPADQLERVIA